MAMRSGAHAPNGPITPADIDTFKLGGFRACKLMSYHGPSEVERLREAGCEYFLVRLPDEQVQDASGKWIVPSFGDYALSCADTVRKFYPLGITDYQVGNEPNELEAWKAYQPPAGQTVPQVYAWWLGQALTALRARTAPMQSARFGLPPVSFGDTAAAEWVEALKPGAHAWDWVSANAYWQYQKYIQWGQFGGTPLTMHQAIPDKPVIVTEYGNSIGDSLKKDGTPYTPTEIARAQASDYPAYLSWLRSQEYIESAFVFLIGGYSTGWASFSLSDMAAKAMNDQQGASK